MNDCKIEPNHPYAHLPYLWQAMFTPPPLADPDEPFRVFRTRLEKINLGKLSSSCKVALTSRLDRRTVLQETWCASFKEEEVHLIIAANLDAANFQKQLTRVEFTKEDGEPTHEFEYLHVFSTQLPTAIAALNESDRVRTGKDMDKKPKYRTSLAPKPSRAQRTIPRKSKNHFVGALTFGEELGQGQVLGFESMLEHNIGLVSIYSPGVIDVREQVRVVYAKANGKTTDHFIDFVTVEKRGRRTALIVKPHWRAVRAKFRDTVARVAAAAIPSVVDRLVVVTERVLDPVKLARVEQFHASRFAQPEFDTVVRNALKFFEGTLSIREFLAMAGLGNEGFHAVVRMVRFGLLDAIEPGLLKLSSPVQPLREG